MEQSAATLTSLERTGSRFAARLRVPERVLADSLGLLVLVAAAVLLRVLFLEARSVIFEEAFSVEVARLSWSQAWQTIASIDSHPPLYYLLLKLWLVFDRSPAAIRSLSVLLGSLAVVPTYLLARSIGGRSVAFAAGILVAGSALAIQASVEARMYPLLMLLVTGNTYFLLRAIHQPQGRGWWMAYGLSLAVSLYAHYFAFFMILAHGAYVLAYARSDRAVRRNFLLAIGGAFLAYAPWWPAAAHQQAATSGPGTIGTTWGRMPFAVPVTIVALHTVGGYFLGLGGYHIVPNWRWLQLFLLAPFVALAAVGALTGRYRSQGVLVLLSWLVPLLVLTVGSVLTGVYYARPRTTSFLMPFFAIMLALGLSRVAARGRASAWLLGVAVGLVVTLNLLALRFSLADTRYVPFNWAGAARLVQENWRSDDALVFYPVPARIAFSYYFPGAAVNAVTIVPPAIPGLSTEWLANRVPPVVASVKGAPRVWFVLTGPTPPGTVELLLGALERAYRRQNVTDFGRVWVFLYATRAGESQ